MADMERVDLETCETCGDKYDPNNGDDTEHGEHALWLCVDVLRNKLDEERKRHAVEPGGLHSRVRGAIAFLREAWFRNDGAEGESVHLVCKTLEAESMARVAAERERLRLAANCEALRAALAPFATCDGSCTTCAQAGEPCASRVASTVLAATVPVEPK
jgi:hypothetical protein